MSNRDTLLIVLLLSILLIGAASYFLSQSHPHFDWDDSSTFKKPYAENSDQPYGTKLAYDLLTHYFRKHELKTIKYNLAHELPGDSVGLNYVYIGDTIYLDSLSRNRLTDFVARGNTALIVCKYLPFELMHLFYTGADSISLEKGFRILNDTFTEISLIGPKLKSSAVVHYARQNMPQQYEWQYLPLHQYGGVVQYRTIGFLKDSLTNFAELPYGRGRFLLHTNPIVFSNFSLLNKANRPYVEGLLSWLPEGKLYWDAASRYPVHHSGSHVQMLTYILKQPALAWAWYILIGLSCLWVIFRGKRRQRVIPVLPANENSSYEFISTIANLQFRSRNYKGQCIQNMKLFLAQIRERYGLVATMDAGSLQVRVDDAFFKRLAALSRLSETEIRAVFTQYSQAIQYEPTEDMMVDLHLAMERFFKRAR